MSETYDAAKIRDIYSGLARWWWGENILSDWVLGLRRLRKRLMAQASGTVLDVACGTGENFPHLRHVDSIVAVDLSPDMLAGARRRADRLGLDIELVEVDAASLPFPDASFDTVTTALSTCTFPDTPGVLAEMRRVVKPGGRVLLMEHGLSSVGWVARWQRRRAGKHYSSTGCRWTQEPVEVVEAAGLSIDRSSRHRLGMFHAIAARP